MIPIESQRRMVREWCKVNGVCPPAEGFEEIWYGRVVVAEEDNWIRNLPTFKASNQDRDPASEPEAS